MPQTPLKYWLLVSLVAIIWGLSFTVVPAALQGFGAVSVAAFRVTIAAACLYLVALQRGHRLPGFKSRDDRVIWGFALGLGIFSNALPFALLSWAQQTVASGFAGITMASVPLFILPLAHIFVAGETLNSRKVIGFSIGFVGVVILIGLEALQSTGADFENLARLTCFAAAACYAIGNIIARLCPPVSSFSLGAAALFCAAIISLPFALAIDGVPKSITWGPTLALIYLGILPTAVAKLIQITVVRGAGPSFMGLTNYQVPVWAVLFGILFWGERLPSQFIWALGLILIGTAISQKWHRRD